MEAASPSLAGPGLAGLIMIVPSIPDSAPDGVCPVEVHTAVKTNPKITESVWILTDKSIHRECNEQGNRFIEAFEFCQIAKHHSGEHSFTRRVTRCNQRSRQFAG